MKQRLTLLSMIGGLGISGGILLAEDWTQWGGTNDRNMVSSEKGIPGVGMRAGKFKKGTEETDLATTKHLKWVAKVGSQTYGTPTIADGRVYVGTNNESPRDPKHLGDRGNMMVFD